VETRLQLGAIAEAGRDAFAAKPVPAERLHARPEQMDIGKRVLDFSIALVLLVVLVPLIVAVAVAIKLDSRGPVFYRCRRVGFRGSELRMLKFRKMSNGASGLALTTAGDARLTRCGRILAATKLDELPQLWHVFKGEMSLVGPRPEDPDFVALYPSEYETILDVKPGMTGLCQLAFVGESKLLDPDNAIATYVERLLPAKVELDLLYARRRSLRMDIGILIWTALALLLRQDLAVSRASGRLSRRRPDVATLPEMEGSAC